MKAPFKAFFVGILLVSCSPVPKSKQGQKPLPATPPGGGSGNVGTSPLPSSCSGLEVTAPAVLAPEAGKMIRYANGGRVRQRHESNGSFGGFGDLYFEKRTYEYTIEDYTPTGDKRVLITLKPNGPVETGTMGDSRLPNIRVFQNGGENPDLFNSNNTLKYVGDGTFTFEIKSDDLKPGKLVSFEFGFFFDRNKLEGRDSYYSDTFRFIAGKPGMVVGVPLTAGTAGDPNALAPLEALSGGQHTVALIKAPEDQKLHFSQATNNISGKDMQAFVEGRSLFHSDFASGSHSEREINFSAERIAKQKGLAGPAVDANACSVCHMHNGTFSVDEKNHPDHVLKVSKADGSIHPELGLQIQRSEQLNLAALKKTLVTKEVAYEDGSKVTLSAPKYILDGALVSARIPQMVYGLGLLEAVPATHIAAMASCKGDEPGISGKMAEAMNPSTGTASLGRFGWKAGKVSLEHQVSEAALLDIGVTSPMFPSDSCEKTGKCSGGTPELPQEDIDRMVTYMRNIAVPVQRNTKDPRFVSGKGVFTKLGCGSCHLPTMYTGDQHPSEKLRNQTFHPFTDLLLHDMGEDLADGKTENNASGREWRTAPLWGLGLMKTVGGQMLLLHDGRAKSYEEAILWHGGEAVSMREGFRKLPKAERDDLYFYLESI